MDIEIRPATTEDVELLFDIRTSVVENHQSRLELASIGVTPASVATMLNRTCRAWIAIVDGTPAAFSMADASRATIFAMFVRPGYEGMGLGRRLMHDAASWLFGRGIDEIWLTTGDDPDLRAHGFYRHLGWSLAGAAEDNQLKYIKRRGDAAAGANQST